MTVSFFHSGNANWASWRLRAALPASYLHATFNDPAADVYIFSKPVPNDVITADYARASGRPILVDYCDAHLERAEYVMLARLATVITCATPVMAELLRSSYPDVTAPIHVIPEPYEFPEQAPHVRLQHTYLWFGHASNIAEVRRIPDSIRDHCVLMSEAIGTTPWSLLALQAALARADVVLLPTVPGVKLYKSANRLIESVMAGCLVIAEPHPSRDGLTLPGVHLGDLAAGLHWVANSPLAFLNAAVAQSQDRIREPYSLTAIARQWQAAIDLAVSTTTARLDSPSIMSR